MSISLGIRRRAHGFSLIEIMVAVFVLSVGLLGMAALMATSLRNTQSADYRSQAVNLAYDAIEMMRSNLVNTRAYERAYTDPAAHCSGAEAPFAYGTATDLFTDDRNYWGRKLCRTLPNGRGRIQVGGSIAAGYAVDVEVCWTDNRAGVGSDVECPNIPLNRSGACSQSGTGSVCAIRVTSRI